MAHFQTLDELQHGLMLTLKLKEFLFFPHDNKGVFLCAKVWKWIKGGGFYSFDPFILGNLSQDQSVLLSLSSTHQHHHFCHLKTKFRPLNVYLLADCCRLYSHHSQPLNHTLPIEFKPLVRLQRWMSPVRLPSLLKSIRQFCVNVIRDNERAITLEWPFIISIPRPFPRSFASFCLFARF